MKQFIALYFLFLVLLFSFFYAPTSALSIALNTMQTQFTLDLLDIFLKPEQLKGIDIWINPHYKIVIGQACNGMIPLFFFYASILAYPASIRYKILWLIGGYFVYLLVNVVRILLVVYVTETGKGHHDFYWSHDLIGNAILMLTGLSMFIIFIKHRREV